MVISHAQPLLLFVSIFYLPAVLGTAIEFKNNPYNFNNDFVNVTGVEIIPYPITFYDNPIFKITCFTSQEGFAQDYIMVRFGLERPNGLEYLWRKEYALCDLTKCPFEPGPFVLSFANIYDVKRSFNISGEYEVTITILHGGNRGDTMNFSFKFHANALAEFINIPRLNGVNVSKVEIFPFKVTVNDNPVFRITADTAQDITSSSMIAAKMVLEDSSVLFHKYSGKNYNLCDSTDHCPVVPGRFVLTFPHPYWRYKIEAGRCRVEVQIFNQKNVFQVRMNLAFWFSVSEA
ncbi:unnamed protein product [Eruca vesicaria subsp. sativa]|uniref:MD-2-related lipid-recognition domain-containing protein n=1 Tax=Eruca vesicaria subsp. sativa TaxID=29727 RepID=A0ABC8KV94_ERUVS|nr:unnamed protein product [Eruca vesicaria subsp. sativa]